MSLFDRLPARVSIVEVGPRDGLQNEATLVSETAKIAFVDALSESGLQHIEVTSFVRGDVIPQLADAEAVVSGIDKKPGVRYTALVPNRRGLLRAQEAGVESIAVLTAASDSFNERNIGCDTRSSIERIATVVESAKNADLQIRGYISTAFHCPYEGLVDPRKVADLVEEVRALGIVEISIGDTTGRAFPTEVRALLDAIGDTTGLALHLHDTHGRALANALTGLCCGVREFDSSAGGLGGCPFAPGSAGNVATESLVKLFEGMGVATGVDVERVRSARAALPI